MAGLSTSMKLYGDGDENRKSLEDDFRKLDENGKIDFFRPLYGKPVEVDRISQFSEELLNKWGPCLQHWKEIAPSSCLFLKVKESFLSKSLDCRLELSKKEMGRPVSALFGGGETEEGKLVKRLLAFEKKINSKPPVKEVEKPPVDERVEKKENSKGAPLKPPFGKDSSKV